MVLAYIYLYLFILICVATVGWSIIRLERIYQYPFFMASVFLSFILPQAFGLINTYDNYRSVVTPAIIAKTLLYSCMCAGMCWLAYQGQPNQKWLVRLNIPIDERKLFRAAIVLSAIGHLCTFLLSRIEIQRAAHNNNWTGPATILYFFSGVLYIALPIFLIITLIRPHWLNITLTVITAWPILQRVINGGRRQETVALVMIVVVSFFFVKRYIPPRWLFVGGIFLGAFIIPALGRLRGGFWTALFNGDWELLTSIAESSLDQVTETGDILELRNAALIIDSTDVMNQYGYGTGLWDWIIFQFVPGQIVGFDVKESLQFKIGTMYDLETIYGYRWHTGTTDTGMGDSFSDFGYFGCLAFALMAFLFKNLWVAAAYRGSIIAAILYASLIDSAMIGVSHGIGRFVNEFIFKAGVVFLVAFFCRRKVPVMGNLTD
jgi:hypothetical protein